MTMTTTKVRARTSHPELAKPEFGRRPDRLQVAVWSSLAKQGTSSRGFKGPSLRLRSGQALRSG